MKLCSIASSSSGNCIYVGDDTTGVLIDAGISKKKIIDGLNLRNIDVNTIKAILVTHEHSDHIQGLGVMARGYSIPIYSTVETINAILKTKNIGKIPDELFHCIAPNEDFMIDDLLVHAFSMSHDAANPVCYTVSHNDAKVSVATDIGIYNDYIVNNLKDSSMILIEANHDVNMLEVGPYSYYLKQRILGDHGHLSNENCGRLLCDVMSDKLKHVLLGHLSKENNYPELAYETVKCKITEEYGNMQGKMSLCVARRDEPSEILIA